MNHLRGNDGSARILAGLTSGRVRAASLVTACLAGLAAPAFGDADNFNSGTLTGWATSISSNYPGSATFVTDVFGGKALRLKSDGTPLAPYTNEFWNVQNTARVMMWRTNQIYTNFYVAVDLVGWNTSIDTSTNDVVFGLLARATNVVLDPGVPVGRPDGVIFGTRFQGAGGLGGGTRGQLNIYGIQNGEPVDNVAYAAACQGDFTINPGHTYRFVFTGTNYDTPAPVKSYYGRVYDREDLTRPLATISGYEPFYPFGGIYGWRMDGYSGLFVIGMRDPGDTNGVSGDATFDNFVAAEYPPAGVVTNPATAYGTDGVPQVVNRQPTSWSNFYAPAGGITFKATTLSTTNNISDIRMFVNGLDVTSSLGISGPATNRSVAFFGLTSNAVYDARIELVDALGRKTTNVWTFDTFSDEYLASGVCKTIECEDFDFDGGVTVIDNPVASGYTWTTTYNNNLSGTPYPWVGAINQGSSSYVLREGVNARTNNGVGDFFDYDGKNRSFEADYRPLGSVGTSEGYYDFVFYDYTTFGQNASFTHDTQRQKYSSVNSDLLEYILERTEGGEWYNYTRTFASANYYNVYLRHGCELSQQLSLDVVGGGNLGGFSLVNALAKSNFRYAPLMTQGAAPAGNLIVNGDFAANASAFTLWPGYTGGGGINPSSITGWTGSGAVQNGLNGAWTSVGYPFAPDNPGGATAYAFLQGTGQALVQNLTTLAPSTTYQLGYWVAGRAGNTASYRVVVYSDNTYTASYYDSGVQAADSTGFVHVTASFTTPATLGSAPNIQLLNSSAAGDITVDYANVFLVAGSSPASVSSRLAVVNLSGVKTIRLTVAEPQQERFKQGLFLNYMAFVPALLVFSSPQVATGYTLDTTAAVEPGTRTLTIPQSGAARFYRLRWDHPTTITSVTLAGGNVVLKYQ